MLFDASRVAFWNVRTFMNLCTDSPPVYFAAPMVGRVWLGPEALSPCVTV